MEKRVKVVDQATTFERAEIQIEPPTDSEIEELEDIKEKLEDIIDSEDNEDKKEMLQNLKDAIGEIIDGNFEPFKEWLDKYSGELLEYLADKALEAVNGMFQVGNKAWLADWRETINFLSTLLEMLGR